MTIITKQYMKCDYCKCEMPLKPSRDDWSIYSTPPKGWVIKTSHHEPQGPGGPKIILDSLHFCNGAHYTDWQLARAMARE